MSHLDEPDLSPSFAVTKPLLCFQVEGSDDPEDTMIVFAKSHVEAKRDWATEHGDGDRHIAGISAKRQPQWDIHAPGPVPALELIDAGWWFECHGCGTQISTDYIGTTDRHGFDEDEWALDREYGPDLTIPKMAPVELPHQRVFCTQACCDSHLLERSRIKRMKRRAEAVMKAAILRRFPTDVEFLDGKNQYWSPHFYVARRQGYLLIHQAVVSFMGPGMQYGASLRSDDEQWRHARVRTERWSHSYGGYRSHPLPLAERKRETGYTCAANDQDAFQAWADACKTPVSTEGE